MVVYIDIDETICGYNPPEDRDYNKAIPNIPNIIKANKLYNEGHTVVYWSARGAVSGIDWTELTKEQLDKPFYDVFIDDKNINVKDWKDNLVDQK